MYIYIYYIHSLTRRGNLLRSIELGLGEAAAAEASLRRILAEAAAAKASLRRSLAEAEASLRRSLAEAAAAADTQPMQHQKINPKLIPKVRSRNQ
jgi:hypothetical protein